MREIRPSGADTWMLCVGAPALVEHLNPPYSTSEHASLGTAAHELGANCLTDDSDPADHKGEIIVADKIEFEVDDDMINAVTAYVEEIRRKSYGNKLFVEKQVNVHPMLGGKRKGTADSIIVPSDRSHPLEIDDYKHGAGIEVFAEKNRQMLIYGAGVCMASKKFKPKKVRLGIHQPRIKTGPDYWTVSYENLMKFAHLAAKKARIAREIPLWEGLVPGDKQCQWCDAKGACPALEAKVAEVFDDIDDLTETITLPGDKKELARRYRMIPLVDLWKKAVNAEVKVVFDRGEIVPGFKLVEGRRGDRRWEDELAALEKLQTFRMRKDEIFDQKIKSPAKIEKLVTKQRFESLKSAGFITQDEGNLIVVEKGDKRDEVVKTPMFEDIE